MRPALAPARGFVRRPARSLPPGDRGGIRPPCAASQHRSTPIRRSGRAGLRKPFRYSEEGLGPATVAPQTAVGLARRRSRRPVEAAAAADDDLPGHGESQVLGRPNDTSQAGSRESKLIAAPHCRPMGARAVRPPIGGHLVADLDRPGSRFWVSTGRCTNRRGHLYGGALIATVSLDLGACSGSVDTAGRLRLKTARCAVRSRPCPRKRPAQRPMR
jgi:hypothetical protein